MRNEKPPYKLGLRESGVLLLGYLAAQLAVAAVGLYFIYGLHLDFKNSSGFLMIAYLVSMLGPILFFDFFVARKNGRKLNLNFQSKPLYTYILSFGMLIGMMLIAEVITNFIPVSGRFFGPVYHQFTDQMNSLATDTAAMLVTTVLFAPLLEEIIFRGIIMKGLLNNGLQPTKAILISAFIFGAIHFYPWQFVGAFLIGTVLGMVYWKTKSLLLPMIMHAFNNFVCAIMVITQKTESFAKALHLTNAILLLIGCITFGISYYFFTRKYRIIHLEN